MKHGRARREKKMGGKVGLRMIVMRMVMTTMMC